MYIVSFSLILFTYEFQIVFSYVTVTHLNYKETLIRT